MIKDRFDFLVGCFIAMAICHGCVADTSTTSAEESTYLADYESPINKWGFIDTTGKLVIDPVFDDVETFSEGYAAVNQYGKWGYINHTGQIIIKPQYKSAWAFHEGMARVKPFDKPGQYISPSGKIIASETWEAAADFSGGHAKVSVGNAYGYIDTLGMLIIPAIYERAWNFKGGLAVIGLEGKLGVINPKGEMVIPTTFEQIKILDAENLILCNAPDSGIVFDLKGKVLARIPNTLLIESNGSIISTEKDGQMFFYSLTGNNTIRQPSWSNLLYLGENRWAGKNEYGYLLLDSEGKILSRKTYGQINRFVDGQAAYHAGTSWGYMDLDGTELTIDVFGLAWDYKEGFARVAFADGIAYLDRKQKLAFYPPGGTIDMRDFSESLAPVQIAR